MSPDGGLPRMGLHHGLGETAQSPLHLFCSQDKGQLFPFNSVPVDPSQHQLGLSPSDNSRSRLLEEEESTLHLQE